VLAPEEALAATGWLPVDETRRYSASASATSTSLPLCASRRAARVLEVRPAGARLVVPPREHRESDEPESTNREQRNERHDHGGRGGNACRDDFPLWWGFHLGHGFGGRPVGLAPFALRLIWRREKVVEQHGHGGYHDDPERVDAQLNGENTPSQRRQLA
jgi:hypothetical protein